MFSSPPAAPPQSRGPSSGATNVFATPAAPGSGMEAMQGPSEYTRMMSRPQGLPGAGPGAPPSGTPPGMAMPGMPQAPQMPQVAGMPSYSAPRPPQMPPKPQMPAAPQIPAAQVPKGPVSNTMLIVIICVLAVAAVGLVLFLLLHH